MANQIVKRQAGDEEKKQTSLFLSLEVLRVQNDLVYLDKKIAQYSENDIGKTDNPFKKMKEGIKNVYKKSATSIMEYQEKKTYKESILSSLQKDATNDGIEIIYDKNELSILCNTLFKDDPYSIARLNFLLELILSPLYESKYKEECKTESFEYISECLGFARDFARNMEDRLWELLRKFNISNTDAAKIGAVAGLCAACLGLAVCPLLVTAAIPAGAVAGAAIITSISLSTATFSFVTAGAAFLGSRLEQRYEITKAFYECDYDSLSVSLITSLLLVEYIKKNYSSSDSQEIVKNNVGAYIDLKKKIDEDYFLN